jgi:hypothetical protein|tara:strand:- start:600 stop:2234 length:1635 start_codon:yes stop_codon:yes gene_type:complete
MFSLKKIRGAGLMMATLMLGSCSDYKLSVLPEEVDPGTIAPEIEVTPVEHDFGAISADGEVADTIVSIFNYGNDTLIIDNIYLSNGASNFTISSLGTSSLESYESADIIVSYDPATYENNSDEIIILSNDEDEPEVIVLLDGSGDAPLITISPEYHDFNSVYLGCDDELEITVGNVGNSNLIISDLEYFATIPNDFSIQDFEMPHGPLPITISPGDSIDLWVDYIPLDTIDDSAYIEVTSNDPATPVATSDHDGLGDYEAWVNDNFTQDGTVAVDILFVIDNSGSMGSNQTNIKNNFDTFMNAFSAAGVSYNMALITTDSSSFVGPVISEATADPITEFNDQIDSIGTRGSAYEKGLWYAYESTTTGDASIGSSTGFFRSDARLVVVYVSDEPDHSHQTYGSGGSTTMVPADYSSSLLSLKSSSDLVVAHAIAGDSPSGCTANGGAQFGDGYYDVVNDLSGTFMSICATDWSVTMDTLARDSMAIMSFPLSDHPIEDTISVMIDGILSTDWNYDPSANSISFTVAPVDGSSIDVSYATWADCDI